MLIPNSSPERPQPAAFAAAEGRRAPPPQRMRSPSRSIVARPPSSLIARPRNPSSATSRFEPDPTTPTARPSASAQRSISTSSSSPPGRANHSAGAAGANRGQAGERAVALDPGGRPRSSASLLQQGLASSKTSPAPIVTSTMPAPPVAVQEARRRARRAASASGSHQTGLPPIRSAAARATSQAADPGQLADRLLAGRVDVEHRDLVGQGERRPELLRERLGARVEVGLEDGDQALRPELAQGREGGARPRSGDGRSRRICGRRRARPSAPAAAAPRGSRRAPPRPHRRRARPARSPPGRRGR